MKFLRKYLKLHTNISMENWFLGQLLFALPGPLSFNTSLENSTIFLQLFYLFRRGYFHFALRGPLLGVIQRKISKHGCISYINFYLIFYTCIKLQQLSKIYWIWRVRFLLLHHFALHRTNFLWPGMAQFNILISKYNKLIFKT